MKCAFPPIGELAHFITLPGYGFHWFLLAHEMEAPKWHEPAVQPLPEFRTLVVGRSWSGVVEGPDGALLWQAILPEFLPNQRWFAGKGRRIVGVAPTDWAVLAEGGEEFLLVGIEAVLDGGERQHYLLALAIAWETPSDDPRGRLQPFTLARARTGGRIGAVHDAMATAALPRAVVRAVAEERQIPTRHGGRVAFRRTKAFADAFDAVAPDGELAVERLGREQSNTSVLIGEGVIFKALRRIEPGIHPELEIGRFLTDVAGFTNAPALLGSVEMLDAEGNPTAIGVLQAFVRNQGDGWHFTLDYLERVLSQPEFLPQDIEPDHDALHVAYRALAETLGRRIGELHRAFALPVDDPAFRPEPADDRTIGLWVDALLDQAASARAALERALEGQLAAETRAAVEGLLEAWPQVGTVAFGLREGFGPLMNTRIHGDLHLGQVVVVREDFYVLDFEGEPLRPMAERRIKQSPLKDVAGMLRSFDYAAHAALRNRPEMRPEVGDRLRREVELWRRMAVERFLAGYRQETGGCASVPADDGPFHRLLDLFLLEKVLYEIRYEAANRPDWLAIPVEGARRLLTRLRPAPGTGLPRP